MTLEQQLENLFESSRSFLSDIKPSEWAEKYRSMGTSESGINRGKFSYDITPYCKEIVNCMTPDHPARIVAVKKGSGVGFSTGVIEPAIGWTIAENPGNILFLVGHADLATEAVAKLDLMIDSCGIRHLIKPATATSKKTGDTASKKEFAGGYLVTGAAGNHKLHRQRHVRVIFVDDFDAAKNSSKESGSTRKMIEQRAAAYYNEQKIFYISTPEIFPSNIQEVFLLGDQRLYNVPCPCCQAMIPFHWTAPIAGTDGKEKGGITWQVDSAGHLVKSSVGYVCQECSGFFTDKKKYEMNINGIWMPTAVPSEDGYFSYHLSSLYAPNGMYDWEHYIRDYIQANPQSGQIEHLQKTLVNLCWGEPFEQQGKAPKGNDLQKNTRDYKIGTVPERLSIKDGNGEIVLITCGADMNGVLDDARLDYEIVAWSESGSQYSIQHGSIGTFIPRENAMKNKADRERWTYEFNKPNSVWPEFEKIITAAYVTDTERRMQVYMTGLDSGYLTANYAYNFVDNTNANVIALKGKDADKYMPLMKDVASFHHAKERAKLYLVEVNYLKDQLAARMILKWRQGDEVQPPGFMNFPQPGNGLYGWNNFFEHYESEKYVVDNKDGQVVGAKWEKKNSTVQNHMFDCAIYNMVVRDIIVDEILSALKIKHGVWADFVNIIMGGKKD